MATPYSKRLASQTFALTKKNLTLAKRNVSATATQLCVGVGLLLLMVILKAALVANTQSESDFTYSPLAHPRTAGFSPCTVGPGLDTCYQFAYANAWGTGNDTLTEAIIDRMAAALNISPLRNVSRGILAFPPTSTAADVDAWILRNPNVTKAVILFENSLQWPSLSAPLRYTMQTNATQDCKTLVFDCTEPMLFSQIPIQTALDASLIAVLNESVANATIQASFTNFPHPDLPSAFDVMQQYGALFMFVSLTFLWVILLQTMVGEKEDHLVESMRQMGMLSSAYWISWIVLAITINTMSVFLLLLAGFVFRFDLFLTAMAFSALAFFFSTLTRSTATARVIGVGSFLVFFVAAPVLTQVYFSDPSQDYDPIRAVISLLPFIAYFHIIQVLINGSSGSTQPGIKWSSIADNLLPASRTNTYVTYWSLESSLNRLVLSFFLFTLLAVYLENVLPTEYGRKKPLWFLFQPSYWGLSWPRRGTRTDVEQSAVGQDEPPTDITDQDVQAEGRLVGGLLSADPRAHCTHSGRRVQGPV
jgi:hypothetical protein